MFTSLGLLYFSPPNPSLLINAQIARENGHLGLLGRIRVSRVAVLAGSPSGRRDQMELDRPQCAQKSQVTELLVRFREGDREAEAELIPLVYSELRRVASLCLNRERGDHTLQPTALVHEVFLRLTNNDQPQWQNRAHFFGVAARLMRQILVDYARRHRTRKRGGELQKLPLDEVLAFTPDKSTELIMLDQALERLSEFDGRQARIVEMKFFGGLSMQEIAAVLDISTKTATRDWTMARAWLHREITR
jgi:RNA polymerase sigma-70 factor (ECF subfamily)